MLNRGVKLDLVSADPDKYAVGESITWWSFSSTTTNISVLEAPMFLGKDGDRTIFQIMTRHGVDIGAFSVRSPHLSLLMSGEDSKNQMRNAHGGGD